MSVSIYLCTAIV